MNFELPALPYTRDALVSHLSAETLDFHYSKHLQAYVTNLEKLLADMPAAGESLERIILDAEGAVFENAAQVWNHTFLLA